MLIAACDTFRAGAVEQLRTHTRHLNALHPPDNHGGRQMVQLYEKGYGKKCLLYIIVLIGKASSNFTFEINSDSYLVVMKIKIC